jgi:hypothetical protein
MTDAPDILETAQKALELSAKATPGPWRWKLDGHEVGTKLVYSGDSLFMVAILAGGYDDSDAAIIAFARNNLEALALEVLRLREEVDALREVERAARSVAALQPAAYARTQHESDKWTCFYNALAALDSLRGGTGE